MKRKILLIMLCGVMIFSITGCGSKETNNNSNPEENSGNSTVNNEEADLSQYYDHSNFFGDILGERIAWVEQRDYNGTKYGYVNDKGEIVIPLSDEIIINLDDLNNPLNNYANGKVVVSTIDNIIIYDTKGDIVAQYETDGGFHKSQTLSNGNILIIGNSIYPNSYMYIESTNEIIKLPYTHDLSCNDYSEGLVACQIDNVGISYFDEDGKEALKIDVSSNSAYMTVLEGGNFEDGKANIKFQGRDYKIYTVNIDNNGNWLDEPIESND